MDPFSSLPEIHKLHISLLEDTYYVHKIPSDDSCLFSCLSFYTPFLTKNSYQLRKKIIKWMEENKNLYEFYIFDESFKNYIKKLKNKAWGSDLEIRAFLDMIQNEEILHLSNISWFKDNCNQKKEIMSTNIKEIRIFDQMRNNLVVFEGNKDKKKTINLLYKNGNHYELLWDKDEYNTRTTCQEITYDIIESAINISESKNLIQYSENNTIQVEKTVEKADEKVDLNSFNNSNQYSRGNKKQRGNRFKSNRQQNQKTNNGNINQNEDIDHNKYDWTQRIFLYKNLQYDKWLNRYNQPVKTKKKPVYFSNQNFPSMNIENINNDPQEENSSTIQNPWNESTNWENILKDTDETKIVPQSEINIQTSTQ